MTSSIREQIAALVFSKAQSTAGLSGRVYRSRVEAFARNSTPALIMECVQNISNADRAGYSTFPQHLELRFLLLIDDPVPDQAADSILVDLHSRIMNDLSLGGLSSEIQPGNTEWDIEVNGVAAVTTSYVVKYKTLIQSLTSA